MNSLGYKISIQLSIAFNLALREYKEEESQQKYVISNNNFIMSYFYLKKMTNKIEGHKRKLE